uniref:Uncharacterized protein n=1 Tax=Glossina pallidipes TaxID=7398 RepID=A0A1B0A8F5_GLOPL
MLKSFKNYQVFFLHFLFAQAIWAEVSEEEDEELSQPVEKVWERTQFQAEIEAINKKLQAAEQEIVESMESVRNVFNKVQDWAIRSQANVVDYAVTVCRSQVATTTEEAFITTTVGPETLGSVPESTTVFVAEQHSMLDIVERLKAKLKEAYETALNEVEQMVN